jgi:23S rRNA (cytosine1962-C5)-methyltransferase
VTDRPRVVLEKGRDRRVRSGHLWIYAGEIARADDGIAAGDLVEVADPRGRFIGCGYYNPASVIAVRLLTRRRGEAVDASLIRRRIAEAVAWRRRFYAAGESCRLVASEGDWLPGLTVDRYGPWLVVQFSTLGMEKLGEAVVAALIDAVHPRGIYERSDLPMRAREGAPGRTGLLHGEVPEIGEVEIDGLRFAVDLRSGQKTGMYLDHRFNRRSVMEHAQGRKMLDVFCNAGAFALYALRGGAESAVGIDWSAPALDLARRNADLNGVAERCRFVEGNAFDHLKELDRQGERFSLIVLDPPAFTRSAAATEAARRGYKEINLRALRIASPGAILLTASCSYHMAPEAFLDLVREAAADAGRQVTLIDVRGQAPDHPVNLGVPETRYLKCLLLGVRN